MPVDLDSVGILHEVDRSSKGHDLLRHYERHISKLRKSKFVLFEIGSPTASTLNVWADYFPEASIVCLHYKEAAIEFSSDRIRVEVGDVLSPDFFDAAISKHGRPLLVVDDGSHRWDHQRIGLETLLPQLENNGFYVIEDLHSSYEPGFSGKESTPFVNYLKDRIDFLHLRGTRREDYEKLYSPAASSVARQIDYIEFVPRACIIHKRSDAKAPPRPRPEEIPQSVGIFDEKDYILYKDVNIERIRSYYDLVVPRCIGSFSRAAAIKKIEVPPSTLSRLKGVICLPRQILIQDGKLLPESFRRRNAKDKHVYLKPVSDDEIEFEYAHRNIAQIVKEPCFYLDGEHVDHYGHFTLEVLSRLWPFQKCDLSSLKIVTSAKPNPRIAELLAPFGVKPEQIHHFNRPIRCDNLIVASQDYILERSVSDLSLRVWRHIAEYYRTPSTSAVLYLSRSRWKKQRYLNQEEDIEQRLQEKGFEIVHPEDLTVPQQISIISQAKFVAGTSGSGFYNCIYNSIKGQRVILAPEKFVTLNDALVNRQSNSQITYITGRSAGKEVPMLDEWNIDTEQAVNGILSMVE
ncbi:DUF563 domain-containing protein [Aquabacter sp. L1I39]|uniref:glycosyltransferase family 61 protein n=1 Tax=Aquabacter sp. L1I39 TaxID=2820278 RepID=UPI001ADB82E1|nr:glycosyltransferase 61 family protein [Aquabacter sp. L1I39]QTL03946.1 DUF563 domain-containing protein [Aquabacter sp. L1I39]